MFSCKRSIIHAARTLGRRGCVKCLPRSSSSLHTTTERQVGTISPATVQIKQSGSHDDIFESALEREAFFLEIEENESLRNAMAYSLSFADSGSSVDALAFSKLPNALMKEQLAVAENGLLSDKKREFDHLPLPRTLEEALRPSHRAIVITETERPFKIVDVNHAWEGLCGYSFVECQGKSLGCLIQGPGTDVSAVTALMSQLLRGEEAGTILTNYKKDGTKFQNHLRVAPLMSEGKLSHFIGVLQEIH